MRKVSAKIVPPFDDLPAKAEPKVPTLWKCPSEYACSEDARVQDAHRSKVQVGLQSVREGVEPRVPSKGEMGESRSGNGKLIVSLLIPGTHGHPHQDCPVPLPVL